MRKASRRRLPKWLANTNALKKGIKINITIYDYTVSMAGAVGQMNSVLATRAEEAVVGA